MNEDLNARVSYLKGYCAGLELGEETKEQKLLHRIVDLLEVMGEEIEQLQVDYEELFEYTEAIDDDLTELEDDFYEDEDEEDEDEEDDIEEYVNGFSLECPNCREIVMIEDDFLESDAAIELTCPGCGEVVLVDDEEWEEELEEEFEEEEKEE